MIKGLMSKLSIAQTFAVTPIAAVLTLALVAGLGAISLNSGSSTQAEVVDSMEVSVELTALRARLETINAQTFQLITNQAAGQATDVAGGFATIIADAEALSADVSALQAASENAELNATLAAIVEQLGLYKDALDFVGQMLELDFASSVAFLTPFDEVFKQLSADLEGAAHASVAASMARTAEAQAAATRAVWTFVGLAVFAGVAMFALASVFGRNVARSVNEIAGATERLADGDYHLDIDGLERSDELGAVVKSLRKFRDNALKAEDLEADQRALAEANERRAEAVNRLAQDFDREVTELLGEVSQACEGMMGMSEQLSQAASSGSEMSGQMAQSAAEASANVESVAAASEELTASIHEVVQQIQSSSDMAAQADERSQAVHGVVNNLGDAAQQIGHVIQLINDISEQTNLLALNATIEAARAGEAGKGFAVVAAEVKSLASQTAQATDDIRDQIQAIQDAAESSSQSIEEVTRAVANISRASSAIAAAAEEQSASTREISGSVQQAAMSARNVSENVDAVSNSAMQTGDASQEVLKAVRTVTERADRLNATVSTFLGDVRAAG